MTRVNYKYKIMKIMKINILKRLAMVAILALYLQSCSEDFLSLVNPNEAVEETFWTSAENAESAMATIYSPLRGQMYGYYGGFTGWHTMNRADDVWFILGEEVFNWELATYSNTANTAQSDFGRLYNTVNRANVLLQKIGDVKMDAKKKEELIGEAHFLRGYAYFLLVTNFGDVPLRTVSASENSDKIMIPSSPELEVWKMVIDDFKAAKNTLPVDRPSTELGRVTKGTATAYLGKAYVYTEQYNLAEPELASLKQAPYQYGLVEDFADNFTEFTEFNQESVFEFNYDGGFGGNSTWAGEGGTQGFIIPNFAGPAGSGAWFKWMPSNSIVRDFVKEERPDGADTRFDKRMYTSFFWKHSDYETQMSDEAWFGDIEFDEIWEACESKRLRGEPNFPNIEGEDGRFLIKKYTNFYLNEPNSNSMYDAKNRNNNLRVMRFAEVLLLHAEASIKNGNFESASSSLTRIRDRAGLAKKIWAGEKELWEEMIHQNELEFFFEGHRFFDLKRWFDYSEMNQILVDNKKQGADIFQPKHYYLPIPQNELNTNTAIEQHPLWR